MDRLQLISMITTFFAATEASMLQITTPQAGSDDFTPTALDNATNAAYTGALAMHINAAIISFLASFFLINYKVHVAKKEEKKAEGQPASPSNTSSPDDSHSEKPLSKQAPKRETASYGYSVSQYGWSKNSQPPLHLLQRCHALCMILSIVGFALAIIATITFSWSRQTQSVSIFVTVCFGVSGLLLGTLVLPSNDNAIYVKDD
jgi:hypothetical protein